jgi:outer membrane cobalamin receptor
MGDSRITFLLALGATLMATDLGQPIPRSEMGPTMTVTAEAEPVENAKTPNPVKVIHREAIERSGANTVSELLMREFPGQILSNGGVGTSTSMFLGGARTQDVVVTLDGIRLSDPSGLGSVNLSSLGLTGIDRVEVETGPCSSRFGADAMGGVIALYTSGTPRKGFSGTLTQKAGTQGVRGAQVGTAYGWESGWLRVAGDGYQEDQATPTPDPFRSTGSFVGVGQQLGEASLLTLSYRNVYTAVPIPYLTVTPTTRVYDADRESAARSQQLIGSLRTDFSPEWTGELSLGHVLMDRAEPGYPTGFSEYDSQRNQAVGRLGWTPTENKRLSLSVDAYEENAFTPAYPSGRQEGNGKHIGMDLEGSYEPNASLRFLAVVRQQWDRQWYESTGAMVDVPDTDSDQVTWKLGANLLLSKGFRVYTSGGEAYGLPLLSAVMWNASSGVMEPLQEEKSHFMILGASWEQGPWSVTLEANRTEFSQLVYFDLNTYQYANGNDIRIQSAQLTVRYGTDVWALEGFYRNQEARDQNAPEEDKFKTAAVIRRPFQSAGLKGHVIVTPFRFDAHWSWFGHRYENFGGYPATLGASNVNYNDLGVAATWMVRENFSLTLRGEHLLQPELSVAEWENRTTDGDDDAYQIFGFPAQPPTWTLEARYRF